MITPQQRIVCILAALLLLFLIINLIRKRLLSERYSYVWILAGIAVFILPLKYEVIQFFSRIIGAKDDVTTLFLIFGFFVILLLLQLCINITAHSRNLKNLAQKVALLEYGLPQLERVFQSEAIVQDRIKNRPLMPKSLSLLTINRVSRTAVYFFVFWGIFWAGYYLIFLKKAYPNALDTTPEAIKMWFLVLVYFSFFSCLCILSSLLKPADQTDFSFTALVLRVFAFPSFVKKKKGLFPALITGGTAFLITILGVYLGLKLIDNNYPFRWAIFLAYILFFLRMAVIISKTKQERLFITSTVFVIATIIIYLTFINDKMALISALATGGILFIIAFGGIWILKRLIGKYLPLYAGAVLVFSLVGLLFFLLGYFHLATPTAMFVTILVFLILGCMSLVKNGREYFHYKMSIYRAANVYEWLWTCGIFLLALACFTMVLQIDLFSDSVRVHIPNIQSFIFNSGFQFREYSLADYMNPITYAMLSLPYALGGYVGIKMVVWSFGLLLVFAIVDTVIELKMSRAFALGAAFVFFSLPVFAWHYGCTVYLDLPGAFFAMAAFALAIRWYDKDLPDSREKLFFSLFLGLAIGMAMVVRTSGVIFGVGLLVCIFSTSLRLNKKPLYWVFVGILVSSLPHFIVEYYWTGNPILPAFNSFFNSRFPAAGIRAGGLSGFTFKQYLILPYSFTFDSRMTINEGVNGKLGPFFMIFFPLLFIGFFRKKKQGWWALFISTFFFVIQAIFEGTHLRHLLPAFPLFSVAITQGIWNIHQRPSSNRRLYDLLGWIFVAAVIMLAFLINAFMGAPNTDIFKRPRDLEWSTKYYPPFKGLLKFKEMIKNIPSPVRIAVSGHNFPSHLYDADSKVLAREIVSIYLLVTYGRTWDNPELIRNLLSRDYDIWILNSDYAFAPFFETGFQTAERLIYTDNGLYTFVINDDLIPKPGISVPLPPDFVSSGTWNIPIPENGNFISLFLKSDNAEHLSLKIDFKDNDGIILTEPLNMIERKIGERKVFRGILHIPVPNGSKTATIKLEGINIKDLSGGAYLSSFAYIEKVLWQLVDKLDLPPVLDESGWYRFPLRQKIPGDSINSVVLSRITMPVPPKGNIENSAWFRFIGNGPLAVETEKGLAADYDHWLRYPFQLPKGVNESTTRLGLASVGPETLVNVDLQRVDNAGKIVGVYRQTLEVKSKEESYEVHHSWGFPTIEGEHWNIIVWPEVDQPAAILTSCELTVSASTSGWISTNAFNWLCSKPIEIPISTGRMGINLGLFAEKPEKVNIDLVKIDPSIEKIVFTYRKTIDCSGGKGDYVIDYREIYSLELADKKYEYKFFICPDTKEINLWLTGCTLNFFSADILSSDRRDDPIFGLITHQKSEK